LANKAIELI